MPNAELHTKNSTRGQLSLVEILVFNSILDVMKKHGVNRSVPCCFICPKLFNLIFSEIVFGEIIFGGTLFECVSKISGGTLFEI